MIELDLTLSLQGFIECPYNRLPGNTDKDHDQSLRNYVTNDLNSPSLYESFSFAGVVGRLQPLEVSPGGENLSKHDRYPNAYPSAFDLDALDHFDYRGERSEKLNAAQKVLSRFQINTAAAACLFLLLCLVDHKLWVYLISRNCPGKLRLDETIFIEDHTKETRVNCHRDIRSEIVPDHRCLADS